MQCSSCGTQLPAGAAYCPICGAAASFSASNSKETPHGPPAMSFPPGAPEHKPAAAYGPPPYGVPPQIHLVRPMLMPFHHRCLPRSSSSSQPQSVVAA